MSLTGYTSSAIDQAPVVQRTTAGAGEYDKYLNRLKSALGITQINDYDQRLAELLEIAISEVEVYTRLSLQPTDIAVTYTPYQSEPLPYGPVWTDPIPTLVASYPGATVTVSDQTGSKLYGDSFPSLTDFTGGKVSYKAGYSMLEANPFPVPPGLIGAIIEHAAASFRAGSVSGQSPSTYWKTLAAPFRRFDL